MAPVNRHEQLGTDHAIAQNILLAALENRANLN
jgi:hypothetical protein